MKKIILPFLVVALSLGGGVVFASQETPHMTLTKETSAVHAEEVSEEIANEVSEEVSEEVVEEIAEEIAEEVSEEIIEATTEEHS